MRGEGDEMIEKAVMPTSPDVNMVVARISLQTYLLEFGSIYRSKR